MENHEIGRRAALLGALGVVVSGNALAKTRPAQERRGQGHAQIELGQIKKNSDKALPTGGVRASGPFPMVEFMGTRVLPLIKDLGAGSSYLIDGVSEKEFLNEALKAALKKQKLPADQISSVKSGLSRYYKAVTGFAGLVNNGIESGIGPDSVRAIIKTGEEIKAAVSDLSRLKINPPVSQSGYSEWQEKGDAYSFLSNLAFVVTAGGSGKQVLEFTDYAAGKNVGMTNLAENALTSMGIIPVDYQKAAVKVAVAMETILLIGAQKSPRAVKNYNKAMNEIEALVKNAEPGKYERTSLDKALPSYAARDAQPPRRLTATG